MKSQRRASWALSQGSPSFLTCGGLVSYVGETESVGSLTATLLMVLGVATVIQKSEGDGA